ncbi:hypothetical protein DFH07DRAFT_941515 [Mycena maculata]|uniref:Uncharacterized protein n=1 Tax=Mycena maculata TaxID=230809 RepID=A0AAD7NAK4_9AGAR|nr:hypothetical protein DFH07DRAFT_941515 [Mycena maculata]
MGRNAMPVFIHQKFRIGMGEPDVKVGAEFRVLDRDNHTKVTAEEVILELDPEVNTKVVLPENARAASTGWSGVPVSEITRRMFRVAMGEPAGAVGPVGVVVGTEFLVLDRDNRTVYTLVAQEVKVEEMILMLHPSANQEVVLPENASVALMGRDPMPVVEITRMFRVAMGRETRINDSGAASMCRPQSRSPGNARAVVSDWKNNNMILRVFVPEDFAHLEALFPTKSQSNSVFHRELCKGAAHIALSIAEDPKHIVVERFTQIFQCEPKAHFPFPSDPETRLPNVLSGIAHFNYFLEQRHKSMFSTPSAISPLNGVSLEAFRLEGEFPMRKPVGKNLVTNNKISLKWDQNANYGILIRNPTAHDLFPYLFAFDPTDYTIVLLHEPHGRQDMLRSNGGQVTRGMGGEPALKLGPLPQGMEKSSSFLKLFVATKAINIGWIKQKNSPFDAEFDSYPRMKITQEIFPDTWDAFRITTTLTK